MQDYSVWSEKNKIAVFLTVFEDMGKFIKLVKKILKFYLNVWFGIFYQEEKKYSQENE